MYFPKLDLSYWYKAYVDDKITEVRLLDYKGKNIVLMFYPADFTFVCPTEINAINDLKSEFEKRNTVVLFISVDSVYCHKGWTNVTREEGGIKGISWPMISDNRGILSKQFDLLDEEQFITKRAYVILDNRFEVYNISIYHDKIGRSTTEILRILDAMAFSKKNGNICPIDWTRSTN
ncbi:thioredoxin peroxidase [Vairimorpha apis BRL 01]|uniref:Thioredoxin peroxidase n=1 Tax=Vairimorpha apis BRL 01 TaxID=1037528 RepID=T0MGH9_9MICR|nr:thioredoxin peroxidase [Vairimorpha apis BRL 01]